MEDLGPNERDESADSEKPPILVPQNKEQHFLTHDMGGVCARRRAVCAGNAPVDSLEEVPDRLLV